MPLYTDLPSFGYYYSGNISPYSNHSSLGGGYSRNPYTLSSYSGYSRGYSPLLSTISESRVGGVSRINSPTKRLHISTPSYRVPKPIRINTADIDVSANKYRRERPIPPVPIPESCIVYGVSPTKSSSTQDGPYMPRADPHEDDATNRSTIKRGRTVVRLSTVRSRGSGSSQHDKINLKRELANDDECKSDKRICKTPGEKLMEKHLIRDRSSDEQNSPIVDENEEPEAFRGRAPSFHDICKDISSDKLYDDLNAGELRRIVDRRKSEDKTAISPIIEVPAEIVDVFNEDGTFRRRTTLKKLRKSTKAIFVEMPDSSFIDNKVPSDQFANTENKQKEPKSPKFTASVEVQNSGPALRAIATEVQVESTTIKPKRKFFYKIVVEDVIESKIDSNSNIELNAEVKLNSKIIAETKNKDCNANTLILENVMESPEKPLFYNKSLNTSSKNLHSQFKEPQASKKLSKKLSTRSSKSGSTADDSYNFWDVIGSRESVYCNARRQRILEEQRNRFSEAEVIAEIPDTPSVTDSIKTNDLLDVSKPVANPDPVKNSNVAKSLKKMKPANLDLKIQQVSEKNITNDLIKSIASPKKDKDEKTSIHSPAKKDAPSTTKIDAVTSTAITTSTNLSAVKQSNETLLQINKQKEQLENVKNKTPEITPPVTPKSPVQQHFKNKISESVTSVAPKSPTLKNFKDKIPEDTIPVPPKLPIQKNVKENVPEVTTPAAPKLLIHKKMKDNISEDVTPVIPKSPMQKNLKNKTPEETAPVKQNFEKQLSSQSTKKADDFDSDRNKIPAVEEENKINSNALSDTKVINLAPKNEDTKKSPVTNAKNDEVCSPSIKSTEIVNNTSSKPVGKIKGPPDSSKPADASPEKNVSPTKRKTKKYIKAKTSDLRNAPDVKDECELTKVIEQNNNTIRRQSSENDASLYVKIEPKDGHKTVVAKPKQNNIVSNINNNKLTSAKVLDKSKTKTEINHKIVPTKVNDKTDETVNISETESSGPDKIKKAKKVSVKTKSRKESDSNETKLNVQSLDQSQNNEIKIASDKIVIKEKPCQEKCTEPDLRKDAEVKQQSQKSKKSCKSTSKTKIIEEDKTNKKIVSNVISNEETTNEPVKEKENLPQTTDNEKKSSNLSGRQSLKFFTERVTEKVRNPSLHRMPNIPDEPKLKPTLISMNTSSDLTSIAANESDAPLKNRFKLKPKDEPATKPLIATPRPLQAVIRNRKAQQLHQSIDSSDTSDSDWTDSSEEDSEDEYFECGSPLNNNVPSMDSLITTEPSYAYEQFLKTSRIIPPATKIPRFRKYCLDDFNFLKVLGKGSFGKVLLAELKNTEYYYAVKCLNKNIVLEDDDVECTLIERKVLALGTKHPYLCHLFCTFQTDSHLFFVMEYLNGGDLMFHIQHSGRFPEPRASFYAAEIVSGLRFLHKKGIVYRDLKLDNILLDFDGHVRIADFGMCKLQIYLDKTADTFCGTPDYMAPEIIKGLRYNQSVDWWSFGVLLYEMLIGQSPFSGCDEDELFWSICNEIPYYPRHLSNEALEILTRFLNKDAELRLGSKTCPYGDVMDQPFFQYINWDRLERRQLEPPFKPRVMHPLDTQYFDKAFTGEVARLTPIDEVVMRGMDQERFHGFSYTNPNATD